MLCRFYQRGHCKFGDNCRYSHDEHDAGDRYGYNAPFSDRHNYQNQRSGYSSGTHYKSGQASYQDNYAEQQGNNRYAPLVEKKVDQCVQVVELQSVTAEELLDVIQSEMKDWSNSGMWHLSCYGPFKYSSCFPGLEEFSTEEVRFAYIKAISEGRTNDYFHWLSGILNTNSTFRKQLSHVNQQQKYHVLSMIRKSLSEANDGTVQHKESNFLKSFSGPSINGGGFQSSGQQALKVFGAANQGLRQQHQQFTGLFQQQPSHNANFQQTNIFQQQQTSNSSGLFSQPSQPFFAQNQPQPQNFNVINQPQMFSSPANPSPLFGETAFGSTGVTKGGNSNLPFGTASSFSAFSQQTSGSEDGSFYTSMDMLSESDLKEFQSTDFSYIPTSPPPRELL